MAFLDLHEMFGLPNSKELPSNPLMAITLAMTFCKLGGSFSVSSDGKRYIGSPMGCFSETIPQLPETLPHEQFQSQDEWNGGLKLLNLMLHRIGKSDRDYVFDLVASIAVDERKFTPTRDEPTRAIAS